MDQGDSRLDNRLSDLEQVLSAKAHQMAMLQNRLINEFQHIQHLYDQHSDVKTILARVQVLLRSLSPLLADVTLFIKKDVPSFCSDLVKAAVLAVCKHNEVEIMKNSLASQPKETKNKAMARPRALSNTSITEIGLSTLTTIHPQQPQSLGLKESISNVRLKLSKQNRMQSISKPANLAKQSLVLPKEEERQSKKMQRKKAIIQKLNEEIQRDVARYRLKSRERSDFSLIDTSCTSGVSGVSGAGGRQWKEAPSKRK